MAVMAFIGMGIKKFSMVSSNVPAVKRVLTKLTMSKARELVEQIQCMTMAPQIEDYLKTEMEKLLA
jgi:phosphoenolpyruvate-protein kinase (PTS system EI component)